MTPNADANADVNASTDAERSGRERGASESHSGSGSDDASEAARVRLSFRARDVPADAGADEWLLAGDEWIRDGLRADSYLGYLRRVHAGPLAVGEEFEEFVNCGCGRTTDVTLRVEAVEGGDRLGPGTALDLVHRSEV